MRKEKTVKACGKTMSVSEWADELGLRRDTVYKIIRKGTFEDYVKRGGRRTADLTGQTFGSVTVIKEAGRDERGYVLWEVEAPNGERAIARGDRLKSGAYTGKALSLSDAPKTKLGEIYKRFFSGQVNSWKEFEAWALSNGWTGNESLRRKDASLGYSLDNCYFAPIGKLITIGDKTLNMAAWGEELGISRQAVHRLVRDGRLEDYIKGDTRRNVARSKAVEFMSEPKTAAEVSRVVGYSSPQYCLEVVIAPLIEEGKVRPLKDNIPTLSLRQVYQA